MKVVWFRSCGRRGELYRLISKRKAGSQYPTIMRCSHMHEFNDIERCIPPSDSKLYVTFSQYITMVEKKQQAPLLFKGWLDAMIPWQSCCKYFLVVIVILSYRQPFLISPSSHHPAFYCREERVIGRNLGSCIARCHHTTAAFSECHRSILTYLLNNYSTKSFCPWLTIVNAQIVWSIVHIHHVFFYFRTSSSTQTHSIRQTAIRKSQYTAWV